MNAKLDKIDYQFFLYNAEDELIATTEESPYQRLSMKNCQSIERGYDLEDLAMEVCDCEANECDIRDEFKKGFQKALELMGDKKFSEEDMIKFSEYCLNNNDCFSDLNDNLSKFQSLQQTEWEVEIEMEYVGKCNGNNDDGCFQDSPGHNCGCFKKVPKLDADGCLILKRI